MRLSRLIIAAAIALACCAPALAQFAPVDPQYLHATPAGTTVVDTGSIAGQALTWVVTVFGTTVGAALTALLVKQLQKAGIQIGDAARARLQEIVVNGLNAGAKEATEELKGKGEIEIKNATVAKTVAYVQAHGADTIKQMGLDPMGQQAVDAIKARIETAVADPNTPTPAVMDTPPTGAPPQKIEDAKAAQEGPEYHGGPKSA